MGAYQYTLQSFKIASSIRNLSPKTVPKMRYFLKNSCNNRRSYLHWLLRLGFYPQTGPSRVVITLIIASSTSIHCRKRTNGKSNSKCSALLLFFILNSAVFVDVWAQKYIFPGRRMPPSYATAVQLNS